ncbi:hypothetical protein [uncultured Thermanaerothrix sp.]|uniref:hypothetical protein n=1 Tax=uncultured Thermanaerothrix sp. TaxID=1195149 RepID=UPI00262D8586|nr:hypothetical protein [uncultured Thermanaerothrix sp.]
MRPLPPSFSSFLRFGLYFLLILAFLIGAQAWKAPTPPAAASPQALTPTLVDTPTPVVMQNESEPLVTPLPPEFLENTTQTNGIILGSAILVLIVIGGTLSVILRRRHDDDPPTP